MMTTQYIADAIGRGNIAEALNVGATAVSNAVVRGAFPPSWFLIVRDMAERQGIDCPPALFGMKQVDPLKRGLATLDRVLPVPSHTPFPGKNQGMGNHTVADAETITPNQGGAA